MSIKNAVPMHVFKAYDIRGLHETEITPDFARSFGLALVLWAKKRHGLTAPKVAVAHDMRPTSPTLEVALVDGLVAAGARVVRLGLLSTPAFYVGVGEVEADLGVMISASHNPAAYNGLKVTLERAIPVGGESGLKEIGEMMQGELPESDHHELVETVEGMARRASELMASVATTRPKPLKIVCDSANGMGAQYLDHLAELYPELVIDRLFWDFDGTFPNHPADPLDEHNLVALKARILETKADLGIATDGDGDRVFFVDNQGEVVPPAIVRGLLAQLVLRRFPGRTVCYDVRPGRITHDLILEAGGIPHLTRVGHSLIKEEMRRVDAVFGGESSGHFFYALDQGIFEAPILAILDFLGELSRRGGTLHELVAPYKRYAHSGERNFRVADTKLAIQAIKAHFSDWKQSELDGISLESSEVWFNVRASNTEPLLRVNIEGKTEEGVSATLKAVESLLIS